MPTQYPDDFDEFQNPEPNSFLNSTAVPHAQQHANANDAIEAIEHILGLTPALGHPTVADRLTSIENYFNIFLIDGGNF